MERQHIAYMLIAILAVIVTAWGGYAFYNARHRKDRRRRTREKAAHEKRMERR